MSRFPSRSILDFARDDGGLFLLENFDPFPRFVGRRLFVF
jgi:hypothetical protein